MSRVVHVVLSALTSAPGSPFSLFAFALRIFYVFGVLERSSCTRPLLCHWQSGNSRMPCLRLHLYAFTNSTPGRAQGSSALVFIHTSIYSHTRLARHRPFYVRLRPRPVSLHVHAYRAPRRFTFKSLGSCGSTYTTSTSR